MDYKLPVNYTKLHWIKRKEVRLQYIKEQNNICMYCGRSLSKPPPKYIIDKKIDWDNFPKNFLDYPISEPINTSGLSLS